MTCRICGSPSATKQISIDKRYIRGIPTLLYTAPNLNCTYLTCSYIVSYAIEYYIYSVIDLYAYRFSYIYACERTCM